MVTRVTHNHETAGSIPALAANYRPLSEVIAEWRADPEKAARDRAELFETAFLLPLLQGQEPLGAEFEAIWDANAADLYES